VAQARSALCCSKSTSAALYLTVALYIDHIHVQTNSPNSEPALKWECLLGEMYRTGHSPQGLISMHSTCHAYALCSTQCKPPTSSFSNRSPSIHMDVHSSATTNCESSISYSDCNWPDFNGIQDWGASGSPYLPTSHASSCCKH
jgi:hypothetical protein